MLAREPRPLAGWERLEPGVGVLGLIEHINWDPVIFKVGGPLALRWYGLMYVVAFTIGYYVLRWLQRIGHLRVSVEDCTNIIIVGVIGTFLGGRLGHLFFYQFDEIVLNSMNKPLWDRVVQSLEVWKGGMSMHGGIIGVVSAELIYARVKGLQFWNVGDACVHVVPIGVTTVRFGNFINGELYGRTINDAAGKPLTDAAQLPWYAMKFPTDVDSPGYPGLLHAMREDWFKEHPNADKLPPDWGILPVQPEIWQQFEPLFYGRYPSQLVQMFFEGFILLILIWWLRRYCIRPGVLGSLFLIGYAVFRIPAELIRQPDIAVDPAKGAELGATAAFLNAIGMTMGQFLSVLIIIWGAVQLVIFLRPKQSITGTEYPDYSRKLPPFGKAKLPKDAPIGRPGQGEPRAIA